MQDRRVLLKARIVADIDADIALRNRLSRLLPRGYNRGNPILFSAPRPPSMKSVAVFCGSNPGNAPVYVETTKGVGALIAQRGLTLVYGGGKRGLMGTVADAALAAGGRVHGVITEALKSREMMHPGIQVCEVVVTMAERKHRFAELADAFLVLPGGIGTLEEVFDMWSRAQLQGLNKPIGILNVENFYTPQIQQIDRIIADGFLPEAQRKWVAVSNDTGELLDWLDNFEFSPVSKWL